MKGRACYSPNDHHMRFLLNPWALILQGFAIVHFIRRRPDMYWLWVIIFLGPLGAAVYIVMEVVPDFGLLRHSFDAFPRRKRIRYLEALVLDNPAAGNYGRSVPGSAKLHSGAGMLRQSHPLTR